MPAIKTGAHTWVAFTTADRDATGSDHQLQVNDICTVLSDGARFRCTSVDGAGSSTWTTAMASAVSWADVLSNGSTTGANSPQITAGQGLEHLDNAGTPVVRAREEFDSAGGLWKKLFYTAAAAVIATTSVDTATGKWTHDKDVTIGSTAVSENRSLTILTGGNVNQSIIFFGDATSPTAGQFEYDNNLTRFSLYTEGSARAHLSGAAWLPAGTMDIGSSSARWDDVFGVKGNFSTRVFIDNATGSVTNVDTSYDDFIIGDGATSDRGMTFKMDGSSIRKAGIAVAEGAAPLQAAFSYDLDLNKWILRVQNTNELELTNAALYPTSQGGLALGIASTGEWSDVRAQAATITGNVTLSATSPTLTGGVNAGTFSIAGGAGGATDTGVAVTISGGAGGATSGVGGAVTVRGGASTDGDGGAVSATGRNATGTNRNGGNVTVYAGNATGTGTGGSTVLGAGTSPSGTPGTIQIQTNGSERGVVTGAGLLDWTLDVRARGVIVDGDEGTGIASTTTLTNVLDATGDTAAAAIGNWRVNGSAGVFHGWLKIWAGTTYVNVPCWRAA
jgi:hypothetical protein